jgi:transposase
MMVGLRDRLIRIRMQLSNAIRGYAAEFGLNAARCKAHLVPLLERRPEMNWTSRLPGRSAPAIPEVAAQLDAIVNRAPLRQNAKLLTRRSCARAHAKICHAQSIVEKEVASLFPSGYLVYREALGCANGLKQSYVS